ncbi:MAG: GcrA family cell cycle regulator [Rhodospirillaceae bacterium]
MVWTDEQIEMLKSLWGQGKPASEIALMLGCDISRNAIIGKAHRLGLSGRPSPIKKKNPAKAATLHVLTERMCKWPFGDPKKPDFHFCGKAVDITMTYCPEHRALAYTPPRKPIVITK